MYIFLNILKILKGTNNFFINILQSMYLKNFLLFYLYVCIMKGCLDHIDFSLNIQNNG